MSRLSILAFFLATTQSAAQATRPPSFESRQREARRLLKRLGHAHPHAKVAAAQELVHVVNTVCTEALPRLAPLLRERDVNVRLQGVILAGALLRNCDRAWAEQLLKAALADKHSDVAVQARIFLERPDRDAIDGPPLGFEALRSAGEQRPARIMRTVRSKPPRREVDRPALRRIVTARRAQLTQLTRHKRSAVRRGAVWVLGEAGGVARSAIPALLRALEDKDPRVGAAAARALRKLAPLGPRATNQALKVLGSVYWRTRAGLAAALAKSDVRDANVRRGLARLLQDAIDDVAASAAGAARALLRTADDATKKELVAALIRAVEKGGGSTKITAIDALGTVIEDIPDRGRAIVAQLSHPVARVRETAMWCIGKLGPRTHPRAVPLLTRLLRDDGSRDGAVDALGSIGPAAAAAVPRLIKLLRTHGDHTVRGYVAVTLGKIGPGARAAVPALIRALKKRTANEDWLRGALRGIGTPAARKALPE